MEDDEAAINQQDTAHRVLVVDDLRDLVEVLLRLLTLKGYIAEGAYDGWSGLERARKLLPHLLILDHKMSVLSGCDVGRALRKNPSTAHIKIVMHTAVEEHIVKELFDQY